MRVLQAVRPFAVGMMVDRMDIYRHTEHEDEYGATITDFPEEPIYTDVKCRLSWSEIESPRNTNVDYTPVELPIKVFCKYDTDVVAGDYIVVTRYSGSEVIDKYEGLCSDCATYESHKELYMRTKEPA